MKIAILTLDFLPGVGGVQTYLHEVARRLGEAHRVSVVTPVAGAPASDPHLWRVRPSPCNTIGFQRALRRIGADRVLVGHAHPQLLLAARWVGGRYGALVHGNDFLAAQRRWHAPIFNRLLRRARPVIVHSDAIRERLLSRASIEAVVVRPGTDPIELRPPARAASGPPRLVTVARLVPRKGIDRVLRALVGLREDFPGLRYDVIGTGPDRPRLERLARELGVEAHVAFLGAVPDDELRAAYRRAHVFVMPCREEPGGADLEGFGLVFLEAAASGLPVVAGRSGGAVEAVRDGETGCLVDPENQEELEEVLFALLRDPARCGRLGAAGRQWVETEMGWDRTAREIAGALDILGPP